MSAHRGIVIQQGKSVSWEVANVDGTWRIRLFSEPVSLKGMLASWDLEMAGRVGAAIDQALNSICYEREKEAYYGRNQGR